MPSPIYRLLEPALNTAPDLDLALTGSICDRVQANRMNWLIPAPATNPGMLGIFNDRSALPDFPVQWAGEFAGKHLISAVQALALTPNTGLESVVSQFITQFQRGVSAAPVDLRSRRVRLICSIPINAQVSSRLPGTNPSPPG